MCMYKTIICIFNSGHSALLYFWTQSDDFAKTFIAFAWRPFLPIFKMVSFVEY